MFRPLKNLLVLGVVLAAFATPALAADEATVVKVALLDISAIVPNEPVIGLMGRMLEPGTVAPGMMGRGPNMMGMGMMSIRVDKAIVKAGPVSFDVTNWSRGMVHEMLVVAVDSANAPLPYDSAKAMVMEEQVRSLGETSELQPSASKTLDLTLTPGTYLLLCNVPGHYASGMVTALTVTP